MNTATSQPTFQQKSLIQQGYTTFTNSELKQLEWGLRFTPAACSSLTLIGLVFQLPYLLMAVGVLGFWAFFAPAGHPMDMLYNNVVRPFFGAVRLPPNPLQRRLACLSAGMMNLCAAGLFMAGLVTAALIVGGALLVLQAIVIFTHFCVLSWMYEGVLRMAGRWINPIGPDEARTIMASGGQVIDVREPNEFAAGHLGGAIHIPLGELEKNLEVIRPKVSLLYCAGGIRSQAGVEKLQKLGLTEVYNLGSLSRARKILSTS